MPLDCALIMLKRKKRWLLIASLGVLCAPEMAIFTCLARRQSLSDLPPDLRWLALPTLLLLLLGLSLFSAGLCNHGAAGDQRLDDRTALPLLFLLNALSGFLALATWLRLMLALFLPAGTGTSLLWAFALAISWMASPFLALWTMSMGRPLR